MKSITTSTPQSQWEYRIVISTEPKPKKNNNMIVKNKTTGKPTIINSKSWRNYKVEALLEGELPPSPIDYPVNIDATYYRATRRRCDLVNLHQAMCDLLVHLKVLKDDCFAIVAGLDGSRVKIDKEHPRTEITITRMEG